jgi:hypothetical protein
MVDQTKEWPEWTDRRGNIYRPGDEVAYATVSGSAGYLVIGEVVKINKVDSKGKPHETSHMDDGDYALKAISDSALAALQSCGYAWNDPGKQPYQDAYSDASRKWNETRQRVVTPSATVAIREKHSAGSYSTIKNLHNIIKL